MLLPVLLSPGVGKLFPKPRLRPADFSWLSDWQELCPLPTPKPHWLGRIKTHLLGQNI